MRKLSMLVVFALSLMMIVPFAQAQSCSSSGTNEEVNINFLNDTASEITIHWLDGSCVEGEGTVVLPGEAYTGLSYDGHEFVFRNADAEQLANIMVNTLISDEEVSIKQWISEGAAAQSVHGLEEPSVNVSREANGLEPIYFSDALYQLAEQAASDFVVYAEEQGIDINNITDGADTAFVSDAIFAAASEIEAELLSVRIGSTSGALFSTETLAEVLTNDLVSEMEDADASIYWLNETTLSYAVYADEHIYVILFSTKSQPTLDAELEAREAEEATE